VAPLTTIDDFHEDADSRPGVARVMTDAGGALFAHFIVSAFSALIGKVNQWSQQSVCP